MLCISQCDILVDGQILWEENQESMPGKEGGKAKPLKKPKGKEKNYDDEDIEFLKKKKAEEAAMKKAREALLKGKKK